MNLMHETDQPVKKGADASWCLFLLFGGTLAVPVFYNSTQASIKLYQTLMKPEYFWFAMAAVLVILELVSSTFYLLVLAVGVLAGGVVIWQGGTLPAALLTAAVVSVIGLTILRRIRAKNFNEGRDATQDPSVQIDIGQTVDVRVWQHGVARVAYRGSHWDAEIEAGQNAQPGLFVIKAVKNNRLILAPVKLPDQI